MDPDRGSVIAVAGASGLIGSQIVRLARAAGHDVVELSRAHGVDLTQEGALDGRLDGVAALGAESARAEAAQRRREQAARAREVDAAHLLREGLEPGLELLADPGIDHAAQGRASGRVEPA